MSSRSRWFVVPWLVGLVCAFPAHGISFTATGTPNAGTTADGPDLGTAPDLLSASAVFALVGGQLQITLTNTATSAALAPAAILTGVYFSIGTNPALTPVSALLGPLSIVLYDSQPVGGVVGGEWAYLSSPPPAGISSTGIGFFGGGTKFPGSDLDPPPAIDGLNYGIAPSFANGGTTGGNAAVTGQFPLIQNSVIFTLSYSGVFDLSLIDDVAFQYGTSTGDPVIRPEEPVVPVPEPATLTLLGCGLAVIAVRKMRANRQN